MSDKRSHYMGDTHVLSFILVCMDKLSRTIIAFLFLVTFTGSMIGSKAPTDGMSSIEAKDQVRSIGFLAVDPDPGKVDLRTHVDEIPPMDQSSDTDKKYFPCESLTITASGAVCDDHELDFPEVNLKDVLDGNSYLPRKSTTVFIAEKYVRATIYRDIALDLRWDPATPEFLQIHLAEYLPYWENRVPYRLFWNARYEICYELCSTFSERGEFLPEEIEGLPSSLAADINFNGVPAAFWNENVNP